MTNRLHAWARGLNPQLFPPTWMEIEHFDLAWRDRIAVMARLIQDEVTILDLGCGPMWLKELLPEGKIYIGCDYVSRGEGTLVADFNQHQFPSVWADVCFVSGTLEYVRDVDWFLGETASSSPALLLSYCTTELRPGILRRRSYGWLNHMSRQTLLSKLAQRGYGVTHEVRDDEGAYIVKATRPEQDEARVELGSG